MRQYYHTFAHISILTYLCTFLSKSYGSEELEPVGDHNLVAILFLLIVDNRAMDARLKNNKILILNLTTPCDTAFAAHQRRLAFLLPHQ